MGRLSLLLGLGARAGATGKRLGKRALDELLGDEAQLAPALDLAARGMQGGRRLLDEKLEQLIGAMGLATQSDLERVHRKIGTLRRCLETLMDEVEQAAQAQKTDRGAAPAAAGGRRKPST